MLARAFMPATISWIISPAAGATMWGFTHICGQTRSGKFPVIRKTMRTRRQAKLQEIRAEPRRRMHEPVPQVGAYLRSVVADHVRYYGVPMNGHSISAFRREVSRLWWKALNRRSQKRSVTWPRMGRLVERWLPPARICHPYPWVRLGVTT